MSPALPPRASLTRMKAIAVGLLVAAALLYGAATLMEARHPGWGYVAAFAEAAMIGAIADWFAVVALFRHPLGLPIPHTAIIPSNKSRIGRELANFIVTHFLTTQQVLGKLRTLDPAAQLARALSDPLKARQVERHAVALAQHALQAFDDERVRHFVKSLALRQLGALDVSRLTGQVLDVLTAQGRHQALLDGSLVRLGVLLEDEAVQARIADAIAAEVKVLRYFGLDKVAGQLATRKLVAGFARLVAEMGADPEHELRGRFDAWVGEQIERLKHDPAVHARGEAMKQEVLAHPAIGQYLQGLWGEVLAWLQADLAQPESVSGARVREAVLELGRRLQADEAMQRWINDQVEQAAPALVDRYRETLRRYIASVVDAWDTREMTDELERHIGRDLQFVRVNGTLVGGLVGLAIHSATQWLRG